MQIDKASGACFSLRGLVLPWTKPRKLKHAPLPAPSRAGHEFWMWKDMKLQRFAKNAD